MDLIVDEALQKRYPEISPELEAAIEKEIVANGGPRNPILVWEGHNIIVDGHRRYAICKKHGLPFKIVYEVIEDIEAVG